MGSIRIDEFDTIEYSLPYSVVNYSLANQCFLIVHDRNGSKLAHMSVLIDLVGASTIDTISGVLIHVVAKREDENIPHAADFYFHSWSSAKSMVSYLHIGSLIDRKYLHNDITLPSIVTNPAVSKLYSTFFPIWFL